MCGSGRDFEKRYSVIRRVVLNVHKRFLKGGEDGITKKAA